MRDYSTEYKASVLQPVFPKLLEKITDSSNVLSVPLAVIIPTMNTGRWGRVTTKRLRGRMQNGNISCDDPITISRTLTVGKVAVRMTIWREHLWQSGGGTRYGWVFTGRFKVKLRLRDDDLWNTQARDYEISSNFLDDHGLGSFEDFILNDLASDFNVRSAEINTRWTRRLEEYKKTIGAMAKYL